MKKLLFCMFTLLLTFGVAYIVYASGMGGQAYNPKDSAGAPVTIPVYNNSGSTMDAGDVAVWDCASSTGDNDFYVTTTTTRGTHLVAGVIYPADIAAGDVGSMAIGGIVAVDCIGGTENGVVCTGDSAGNADGCVTQDDIGAFGIVTTACSSNTANVLLFPH